MPHGFEGWLEFVRPVRQERISVVRLLDVRENLGSPDTEGCISWTQKPCE